MLESKQRAGQIPKKRGRNLNGRGEAADQSIIHILHRASQRASEIFGHETREFDLTARQYAVITTIAAHDGVSQTGLVNLTGIDRSTLADVVQRLLKRGIIMRERTTSDGRTYAVSLSDAGRELLQAIKPFARKADKVVLALLAAESNTPVVDILSRLVRKMDEEEPKLNGHAAPPAVGLQRRRRSQSDER